MSTRQNKFVIFFRFGTGGSPFPPIGMLLSQTSLYGIVMLGSLACFLVASYNPHLHAADNTSASDESGSDVPLLDDLFKDLKTTEKKSSHPPSSTPVDPASQPNKGADAKDIDRTTQQAGEDIGEERESVLSGVARRMREVQERLIRQDVSDRTQTEQQRIIDDLEALISQSQQRRSQSKSSSSSSAASNESAADSPAPTAARSSDGNSEQPSPGQLDPKEVDSIVKGVWGQLPDRVREQIRTPLTEEFLPRYEKVIADFYRRLAEENSDR